MIERRVINGKEYWVDVIICEDGSRVETVIGDPMGDTARENAEANARAMEEVLNRNLEANAREFDRQQRVLEEKRMEQEYEMRKQKEELEREVRELELKKKKLSPDYDPDFVDVMIDEEDFCLNASKEEYACYYYMKTKLAYDVCTRKDLNEKMATPEWKNTIYPKLKKENEEEVKKIKEEVHLFKPKDDYTVHNYEKETLIKRLVFGLILLGGCATSGIALANSMWAFGIISILITLIVCGIMYKAWIE